jgi:hypothetical protein
VLGAATAILVLLAATAVAGTGVGGVFNLGQDNTVNKTSTLRNTSAFTGPQLQVKNTAGGAALDLQVNAGKPPLTVNSDAKVAKLNADKLDGLDSSAFARSGAPAWTAVSGTTFTNEPSKFICPADTPYGPNCWANYSDVNGGNWSRAAFTKDSFGFVHLKGLVNCFPSSLLYDDCEPANFNQNIFFLPAGYRPAEDLLFPSTSSDGSKGIPARVDVRQDGAVVAVHGETLQYIALDGITFRATH